MKKRICSILALVLIIAMALSISACGNSNASNDANKNDTSEASSSEKTDNTSNEGAGTDAAPVASGKDVLNVAITQDSGTLDPMFNIGWDCMYALRCIYEPLFDVDEDGNFVWVLATGIDYESPTKWIVHLREGVTFSNGNPFNADDVVFTINRANNRPGASDLLGDCDETQTKKIDDYTVEVNFTKYTVGMETGTWTSIYMFDAESFSEDKVTTETVGTGPYTLTSMVTNSVWTVDRRDDYWGEAPAIKTINFNVLSESTQRVNALETKTADFTTIPFQDVEYVEGMNDYNVIFHSNGYAKTLWFSFDPSSAFYNNVDARKAVSLAIDREAIVDIAYSGHADLSRFPFAGDKVDIKDSWLDQGVYGSGQDVEQAKALAESSGLAGTTIKIVNNGSADSQAVCELIQEDLRAIGVEVEIWTTDSGSWLAIIFDASQWDMAIDFSMGNSAVEALNRTNQIGGGMSYQRDDWEGSARFHELLEGAIGEPDEAVRAQATEEMLKIVEDNYMWLALCDIYDSYGVSKDLASAPFYKGTIPFFKFA